MTRRRARAGAWVALLTAFGLAACSLVSDFDVPVGQEPGRADGSNASDGTAPLGDGGILQDTFETALASCGWTVDEGTATPDTIANTGGGSCRLCGTGGRIRIDKVLGETRPGTYVFEAWFRQLPGEVAPTGWSLRLTAAIDGGNATDDQGGTLDQTWRRAQVTLRVGAGASRITARMGVDKSLEAGTCLLVDDVVVTRTP